MRRKFGWSSNTIENPGHADEVYAKMMQDKSIESPGNEFFGLITKGTKLVMGEFSRLSV